MFLNVRKQIISAKPIRMILFALLAGSISGCEDAGNERKGQHFKFELGKTLEQTAAQTGLRLSGQNNYGLVHAGVVGFPDGVHAQYAVPGFEVKIGPLSAIRFYSDADLYPAKTTHIADLTVETRALSSDAEVYDAVYAMISQFQSGRWQRYIPDECPRLNGRSSVLDREEIAELSVPGLRPFVGFSCPADPSYKPPLEDWRLLASDLLKYQWHDGSGRIATLVVSIGRVGARFDPDNVSIDLEFELEESIIGRAARNREGELKEPWGARVPKVEAEKRRIREILEKRG